MKIGFNLLLVTPFVTDEHLPLIEQLKNVGYDGIELPLFDGDVAHYEKIGKQLKDLGLGCTAVTVIPDQEHNPISPNAESRAGAMDHLKWAIDCCQAAGAETLLGPFHSPLADFSGDGATEQEKAHGAEVHKAAAQYAQDAGVLLAIEYLNRFECYFLNTMADAADYVRRVDHPNFKTMYDTFHANIEEKDPFGIIAPNVDVIGHVHISENDRGTPGKGHIDFATAIKCIKESGYDSWLTIEAFGKALPELAAATRVWRQFFTSVEEVYTDGFKMINEMWDAA